MKRISAPIFGRHSVPHGRLEDIAKAVKDIEQIATVPS